MRSDSEIFNWADVADDVVVPDQAAIAVYLNPKDNIVIRQAGQYHPDEDVWVVFAPEHAPALAEAILSAAAAAASEQDTPASPPEDRTADHRLG